MSETIFKTPFKTNDTPLRKGRLNNNNTGISSSEESLSSICSENSENEISILAEYDDITRFAKSLKMEYDNLNQSYQDYLDTTQTMFNMFQKTRDECLRLQEKLDYMAKENSDLESRLNVAKKLLDMEKKNTKEAERERDLYESQISQVKQFFLFNGNKINEEDRIKFPFLETDRIDQELSCILEGNSTGTILSEFSYSKSEDDLDTSKLCFGKAWKKHRPSAEGVLEQPAIKKRRSSGNKIVEINKTDTVRATTTLTMPKNGPITATSIIEAIPTAPSASQVFAPSAPSETPQSSEFGFNERAIPAEMIFESWSKKEGPPKPSRLKLDKRDLNVNNYANRKQHVFNKKTVVLPDTCGVCQSKLRFGKLAWKCKDCKNICHEECKDKLPTPCIPVIQTPNQRNGFGGIGDYTGTNPPLVPALIIHCVNEIEQRDPKEIGLYRVSGSERDVKTLKERFLKGKAAPCLKDIDIHVLCGVIKDFLKSLQEPLITTAFRSALAKACEANDSNDVFDKISELPQPNRDTLAYMMLHLKRISEMKEIKMTVDNIAKVFGPTIVGYSNDYLQTADLMRETMQNIAVMTYLMNLPVSYWEQYIKNTLTPSYGTLKLQQTPSTDSLFAKQNKTPNKIQINTPKRKRFFPTPPSHKH